MPNLKIVAFSVCEILRGSQNFKIGSRPQATPNFGPVCGQGQELPTAYVHVKFEDRSFPCLRNIEGVPKFRNWVTSPGYATFFWANLWSKGKNCPRPMCVPNLKILALPVCEILRGSQNFEIGSRPQATPNFGPICGIRQTDGRRTPITA